MTELERELLEALKSLMATNVMDCTLYKVQQGQGSETADGKLILSIPALIARAEAKAKEPTATQLEAPKGYRCDCDSQGMAMRPCSSKWQGGCDCCTPPVCKLCGHSEACHTVGGEG